MIKDLIRTAALVTLCFATTCAARAQNCTNGDFRGIYSALVTGSFVTPPPGVPPGPTARVGRVQADGAGVSSIMATLSLLGFIFEEDYGGAYTIRPDCTADVILQVLFPNSPIPVPFHFIGALADAGNVMNLILTDPLGTDLRIVLQRLRKSSCSLTDLNGAYALNLAGINLMVPINPNGLFARVGQVKFDGNGNFDASVHTSYNGVVLPETFSGTYTVNSNCIFHTSFTLQNIASGWTGVLYGASTGAYLLVSSPPGGVVTGNMTAIQ